MRHETSPYPDDGVTGSQSIHVCRAALLWDFVCYHIQYISTVHFFVKYKERINEILQTDNQYFQSTCWSSVL